jgi:hypothetical protein
MERRACFVCEEVGHVAKKCPKKSVKGTSRQKRAPPVVLFSHDNSSSSSSADLLFDSGAAHHIVCIDRYLHDVGMSSVSTIKLGGGEVHFVMGAGNLMIRSVDTRRLIVLTDVLYVASLNVLYVPTGIILVLWGTVDRKRS